MLNLLTIWFRHGVVPEVHEVLLNGEVNIGSVNLDSWLGVVPQLMACINHRDDSCREALHDLLQDLGRKHPQVRAHATVPHLLHRFGLRGLGRVECDSLRYSP